MRQVQRLEIHGGQDRDGRPESLDLVAVNRGEALAVVGPTGSGKSELLSDIEQLAGGDTPSRRRITLDGLVVERGAIGLVATLSQRTNFVMDASVRTFVDLHATCQAKSGQGLVQRVLDLANTLCGEPMRADDRLQGLSGGQTRALMIADIALVSDSPVVLIDEVENAGIDKHRALAALAGQGKIVLTATHDPVLMLMNNRRVVMSGGGMRRLIKVDGEELTWLNRLGELDNILGQARDVLRAGKTLRGEVPA
jgi:ABC-type lipoprotein export system ATPase subunit